MEVPLTSYYAIIILHLRRNLCKILCKMLKKGFMEVLMCISLLLFASLRKYFYEASKMKYLKPLVKIPTLSPVSLSHIHHLNKLCPTCMCVC